MPFKEYEAELQRNLKSGHATEPTYYPALKSLLESLDSIGDRNPRDMIGEIPRLVYTQRKYGTSKSSASVL